MLLAVYILFAMGGEPYSIDGMTCQLRADGWRMVSRRRVSKIIRDMVRRGDIVGCGCGCYVLAGGR